MTSNVLRFFVAAMLALDFPGELSSHGSMLNSPVMGQNRTQHEKVSQKGSKPIEAGKANVESVARTDGDRPRGDSDGTDETEHESIREKERTARAIVDDVLATAHRITPVEYGLLAQVESAVLLWTLDRDRAYLILKEAFIGFHDLTQREATSASDADLERIRVSMLRKIAGLNPDLINDLAQKSADRQEGRPPVIVDWTEEARALMIVANQEIERNPALAAKLAQQSLSFGVAGLPGFLMKLARRDRRLAENQAMIFLARLRVTDISPFFLLNFRTFILSDKETSLQLREYYFESLAIRLRAGMKFESADGEIEALLQAARAARQISAGYPNWEAEFTNLVLGLEHLFDLRSLPVPGFPRPRSVDVSGISPAVDGNTIEIDIAAEKARAIAGSENRDIEYSKLAVAAALKADARLARQLLGEIQDVSLRRRASISVFGPLVRKALHESEWEEAKSYALEILDPLGLSLVVDWVVKSIPDSEENKERLKEFHDAALAKLRQSLPSPRAAKGFLVLARSILPGNRDDGFMATAWAVYALNQTEGASSLPAESKIQGEIVTWIRLPTGIMSGEEALDLTEMIPATFREAAGVDVNEAQMLALEFTHRGLRSLALLGVASHLVDEIVNPVNPKAREGVRLKADSRKQ